VGGTTAPTTCRAAAAASAARSATLAAALRASARTGRRAAGAASATVAATPPWQPPPSPPPIFWEVLSGSADCHVSESGACVTDGPEPYGNNERCTVTPLALEQLSARELAHQRQVKCRFRRVGCWRDEHAVRWQKSRQCVRRQCTRRRQRQQPPRAGRACPHTAVAGTCSSRVGAEANARTWNVHVKPVHRRVEMVGAARRFLDTAYSLYWTRNSLDTVVSRV
jgi:hypothetical protein